MHFMKRIQKSSHCINRIGRSFYVIVIFFGIIPILFSITLCKNDRTKELPSFSYSDTAYLKIQFRNITDSLRIRINSAITFPQVMFSRQFGVCEDDIFNFKVILSKPEYVEIISGDRLQNYLIPGDTLKLIVDYNPNRSFADMAVFEGEGGMIYKYFKAKQQMLGYWNTAVGLANFSSPTYTLDEVLSAVDSFYLKEMAFLEDFTENNELPYWFYETERANIVYGRASMKSGYISYRNALKITDIKPNDQLYGFMDSMLIFNPQAKFSNTYYFFLTQHFIRFNQEGLETKKRFERVYPLLQRILPAVYTELDGEIREYFLAQRINELYTLATRMDQLQMADSLLNQIKHHLDHPQILEILDTQKKEREAYLNEMLTLSPGKTAPMFYLQDENGSFHRLSDYRGRYVYISFWATWCKPCIEQFVDENRLVENYSGGNIEFITICLDQKPDLWIKIINERWLKGIKLICKGNWDKRLQTDYNIIQLPHHVLIDRDGLIIENNCKGPIEIGPVLSELR